MLINFGLHSLLLRVTGAPLLREPRVHRLPAECLIHLIGLSTSMDMAASGDILIWNGHAGKKMLTWALYHFILYQYVSTVSNC